VPGPLKLAEKRPSPGSVMRLDPAANGGIGASSHSSKVPLIEPLSVPPWSNAVAVKV
jgi:hypothetical protein